MHARKRTCKPHTEMLQVGFEFVTCCWEATALTTSTMPSSEQNIFLKMSDLLKTCASVVSVSVIVPQFSLWGQSAKGAVKCPILKLQQTDWTLSQCCSTQS